MHEQTPQQPKKLSKEDLDRHLKGFIAMVAEHRTSGRMRIQYVPMAKHLNPLLMHYVAESRQMDEIAEILSDVAKFPLLGRSLGSYLRSQGLPTPGTPLRQSVASNFGTMQGDRLKRLPHR